MTEATPVGGLESSDTLPATVLEQDLPQVDPLPPEVPTVSEPQHAADAETVRVRVVGPFGINAYTAPPTEAGPGVQVTAAGVDVPAADAEGLILEAAKWGVQLAADSEYPSTLTETKVD
jgi:hypothetical protein